MGIKVRKTVQFQKGIKRKSEYLKRFFCSLFMRETYELKN